MRTTTLRNTAVAMVCAAAVGIAGVGTAQAASATEHRAAVTAATATATTADDEGVDPAQAEQLEELLGIIDDMPDEVVAAGDRSVQEYLQDNYPDLAAQAQAAEVGPGQAKTFGWWHALGCAAAITVALASGAIPYLKIVKLKKFIEKAGGVRKAAYLLIRVATGHEKLEHLGPVLGSLAGEVLGIDSIRHHCS